MNSKEVQRIEDVIALRERQFVEDASPTAHPIQPKSYISMNNFYTATVYEKGAEVIRMLHTLLGEENYRKAMDLYFETFDGQAVTVDDFLWAMHACGSFDLQQFKRWYDQSGTPRLQVEELLQDNVYTLRLTQKIPNAVDGSEQKPYYYPLKIGLLNDAGEEVTAQTLIISKESEVFAFEGFESMPHLSINRDFSAPVIIENEKNDFAFLMQYDTNGFVQYEAAQNFALQSINAVLNGEEVNTAFVEAYGHLLDLDTDRSFQAHLLELPTISAIMQTHEEIDFEKIYAAKEKLAKLLAAQYKDKLLTLYKENHIPASKDLDAQSIAKRAIKNRALRILSALADEEVAALAKEQYVHSVTMTDRIVALDVLENTHASFAATALADFYNKYRDNTLVMNKYFTILASSQRDELLDRVERLQLDEVYDEKVPNLVRSLIGSFARNYKHFHAADGSGYKFLAEKIISLDKINPQMASSLAGAFKIYDKLTDHNKKIMQKELERVVSTQGLSKNTYEIINKILRNNK
jgi:aminopeptidase N